MPLARRASAHLKKKQEEREAAVATTVGQVSHLPVIYKKSDDDFYILTDNSKICKLEPEMTRHQDDMRRGRVVPLSEFGKSVNRGYVTEKDASRKHLIDERTLVFPFSDLR